MAEESAGTPRSAIGPGICWCWPRSEGVRGCDTLRRVKVDVRLMWALGAIVLVGGCTSHSASTPTWGSASPAPPAVTVADSAPPYTEPASYGFVLTRGCDDAKPLGRYRVTVQNRAVTKADRLDATVVEPSSSADVDLGPAAGDGAEEIEVPTLGELTAMAQTATDDGAEVSRAFDAKDGHPVKVTINSSDDGAASATECFAVADYAPAS
jgi:hypothetical protein